MDAETVGSDEDSSVAVEQLQGCFDELKQKLQRVNITSKDQISTASSPALHQQKKIFHDDFEKEEILNGSITSDVGNVTSEPESSEEKSIVSEKLQSLPLIYNVTTNPSLDDQDREVWKYV